jgi:hypothetical protein
MKHALCLIALLLVACGKEEPKPEPKAQAAAVTPKPVPAKKLLPVPQGKLPRMDPEKAKFIAVPSTPKDPEVKKVEKPATETKKATAPAAAANAAEQPIPEVKKAAPAAAKQ